MCFNYKCNGAPSLSLSLCFSVSFSLLYQLHKRAVVSGQYVTCYIHACIPGRQQPGNDVLYICVYKYSTMSRPKISQMLRTETFYGYLNIVIKRH